MPSGEDVGNERQKRECRGSQRGSWRRLKSKSLITIVLVSLLVSLLTTSLATPVSAQEDYTVTIRQDKVFADQPTSLAPPVSAQEDYTVTIGQDKVFTECNYHYARFDNFPELEHLPWPDPDDREAYSTDNTAYVSLLATQGHAARADSWIGVYFDWDLGSYTWEEVENMPVNVTVDFSYLICGDGYGWDCQSIALVGYPTMWYDYIGSADNPDDVGCRSKTVNETYTTTVGELEGWPGIGYQWIIASCLAYSTNDRCTRYSSAEIQVNSIKIEFPGPQITHFTVSLEHYVGPNEEEWYGQQVMASVYHPEGSDQIESCNASDPSGNELPNVQSSTTPDSWNFMWWEGYLPNHPTFGEYTITATDKDGCVAEVTSWPTDHISNRVPTITDPINHYVTTRVPTFRWEPFSGSTGYRVEVFDPSIGETIWAIGLPASQTEVEFNRDGTDAVPELTPGNTYRLFVFAYEDVCDEIQCYRDTSIRAIEFTVESPLEIIAWTSGHFVSGSGVWHRSAAVPIHVKVLTDGEPLEGATVLLPTRVDGSQFDVYGQTGADGCLDIF
jgi:hypothetical protein